MKSGTTKPPKLPPRPTFAASVRRRSDCGWRVRLQLNAAGDAECLAAVVGTTVILATSWEAVGATVYAIHPDGRLLDVQLLAKLDATATGVEVRRTTIMRSQ